VCGIAGILRFGRPADDATIVGGMSERLAHRGPDGAGQWTAGAVTLGHRRLAVLDLSAAAAQPMTHPDGRFVIVFNGEIYNYSEIAGELGLGPADLRTHSDTEVLLHAWARWGADMLPRLVGQWAFAMCDRADGSLYLARDRFGEKPLYFHADADRFAFASSIEALFADPATPRALDAAALAEFVALRYVLAPRTVVAGVHKISAGELLHVRADGTRTSTTWYRPRFVPDADRSARAARGRADEFDARFRAACRRCLVSDVPVGLLLSDGIDSQSILAALRASGQETHAYTFRLVGSKSVAATVPGIESTVLDFTPDDVRARMDHVLARQTEPVGDLAALATTVLIERARAQTTVFLCGHGGDEILGGYRFSQDRFRLAALHAFGRWPLPPVRRGLARHLFGEEPLPARIARFLDGPANRAPGAARFLIQRPVSGDELARLFGGPASLPDAAPGPAAAARLYADCAPDASDLASMQEVLIRSFLDEDILPFADASAMASGAELRLPYLDRDLVELVFRMPDAERVGAWPGRTNTKLPLRRWAQTRVPAAVRGRRKQPFAAGHVGEFLPEAAMAQARILGSRAVRRALPGVEAWMADRVADWPRQAGGILWSLLTLAVWAEAVGAE
jgi:asparagine synthase (glutamine-hydrolysing)